LLSIEGQEPFTVSSTFDIIPGDDNANYTAEIYKREANSAYTLLYQIDLTRMDAGELNGVTLEFPSESTLFMRVLNQGNNIDQSV